MYELPEEFQSFIVMLRAKLEESIVLFEITTIIKKALFDTLSFEKLKLLTTLNNPMEGL